MYNVDKIEEEDGVAYYLYFEKGGVTFGVGDHVYLSSPTDNPYCGKIVKILVDRTKEKHIVEATINWYYRYVDIVQDKVSGLDGRIARYSKERELWSCDVVDVNDVKTILGKFKLEDVTDDTLERRFSDFVKENDHLYYCRKRVVKNAIVDKD